MIQKLIQRNRSYRRFFESVVVPAETLRWLVNLTRLSPSAANLQPLRYLLSNNLKKNEEIFSCLKWAGYLKGWNGPEKGERPSAYIIIVGDRDITENFGCDHGIAAQSILLGAVDKNLGGCIIGSINRDQLKNLLNIPEKYEILLVIALGKPKEKIVVEEISEGESIRYWRDNLGVHHVPKRKLADIILDQHLHS